MLILLNGRNISSVPPDLLKSEALSSGGSLFRLRGFSFECALRNAFLLDPLLFYSVINFCCHSALSSSHFASNKIYRFSLFNIWKPLCSMMGFAFFAVFALILILSFGDSEPLSSTSCRQ